MTAVGPPPCATTALPSSLSMWRSFQGHEHHRMSAGSRQLAVQSICQRAVEPHRTAYQPAARREDPRALRSILVPSDATRPPEAEPAADACPPAASPAASPRSARPGRYDRSIVEGPVRQMVWKLAWPTILQNVIGGLQGVVDHALVGHFVGYNGQRGHRRQLADLPGGHRLHQLALHGHGRARGALRGRRRTRQGEPRRLPGLPRRARSRGRRSGAARLLPLAVPARPGERRAGSAGARPCPFLRILFVFSLGMLLFFMLRGRAQRSRATPARRCASGVAMTALNIVLQRDPDSRPRTHPGPRHARGGDRHGDRRPVSQARSRSGCW